MASKHVLFVFALSTFVGACKSDEQRLLDVLNHQASPLPVSQAWHQGPAVAVELTGPARYVPALVNSFDADRAMETVAFVDRFYRAPANDGYEAVIEHLQDRLRAGGWDDSDSRFELREIGSEMDTPSWTPRSGSVELILNDKNSMLALHSMQLHSFDSSEDADRTMLPIGAPSCDVTGLVCLNLADLKPGQILVTEASLGQVARRAEKRGAAAVLSASLASFNIDPTGADRHLDAIRFVSRAGPAGFPVAMISPRSLAAITRAVESSNGASEIRLRAKVDLVKRPLRTLVAAIRGSQTPDECVTSAAHIQEPGANDNASGVGALLEGAVSLAAALKAGEIDWPKRTLVFVWGDEYGQTETWIADTKRTAVAGISSDMVGNSFELTGARALLERGPDPGALVTLAPDEHTPWGAGEVTLEQLKPNGLAVIVRCAMVDVGIEAGGWNSADHPWEGGSDHDVFIGRGIPAVLLWHFTDFAYHTSLDRMDMVDAEELKRTEIVVLASMLALADPRAVDLERYSRSLEMERRVRVEAAQAAGDEDLAEIWDWWCQGARTWLRAECLGISMEMAAPPQLPSNEGAGE